MSEREEIRERWSKAEQERDKARAEVESLKRERIKMAFCAHGVHYLEPCGDCAEIVGRPRAIIAQLTQERDELRKKVEIRDRALETKLDEVVSMTTARLERERDEARAEVDTLKGCWDACKSAVVHTVGGEVEGKPTNATNYLQRLRELVEIEEAHTMRILADAMPDATVPIGRKRLDELQQAERERDEARKTNNEMVCQVEQLARRAGFAEGRAEELKALLRDLEWVCVDGKTLCPCCGAKPHLGNCKLRAALGEGE